ncbi:uncharacterized protein TRIVIDRAFT_70387 [Trichoderma virens Gv29-8]|uniref:Uncharacterized protein n=1 Tax=Hypocrea virens (strain Gv29-8 / FGSC 10586) TaxID=413071 RepID=G9MWA8_HYPVG|nr:uncharacterized protein TRIVIDRAFT_70387 [Trichoderma virens Gv29-8]EHK21245.1 hypothetical protein TRIVIDRAFT_70387 [Trichoderma virens Gv29-8]UKZ52432.1 hypothetical protein TrVGV298_006209 [Trichoderma virens]
MANKAVLDLKLLRSSSPRGQATHLHHVLKSNPSAASSITSQLVSLVASDSLPAIVLALWPSIVNEPQEILAVIRQELCLNAQRAAISRFYRHLYREKTFAKAWEVAGGAAGIAQLVTKLSVSSARFLFNQLGATGRARGARKERQRAMEELLTLLWGVDGDEKAALDSRPLREEYVKILAACGGAFRLKWEEMKRQTPDHYFIDVETDHEFFEQHYDEQLQRGEISASKFLDEVTPLVIHRVEYGLDVLDRFTESESLFGATPDEFLEAVVDPLSKRFSAKQRVASDTAIRFWSRVMLCLKKHQAFQKDFKNSSTHHKRILARLVKAWNHSQARAEYTEMLTLLFSLIPKSTFAGYSLIDLIKNVAQTRRYQLLRSFLKHTADYQFDIGEPTSLEHLGLVKSTIRRWQVGLFFTLSADEGFLLWEKVQRAGKDVEYRPYQASLCHSRDPDGLQLSDGPVVRALLLNRSQTHSPLSTSDLDTMRSDLRQEVSRRMKKATQGREPEIRARWTVSALALCVAIGDLELYGETLRWARRFNKDPLAVSIIYDQSSLDKEELADLVTVLPTKEGKLTVTAEELTHRIQSANEVLQILFDTALMGINEPSFRGWRDWGNTFQLINRAICRRITRANDFQGRTNISDDALYEALWKPTYAMLERMLSKVLGAVDEKFDHKAYSTLSCHEAKEPETLQEPTIRFLSRLAEYYNSLWAELRLRETPAVVTVDEIWPKGLTLQHLVRSFGSALPYLPYAQSRIEAVVFMNPLKALQPIQIDEESQLAIGTYIDSWAAALQLYIQMPGKLSKEDQRKERISRAWLHATSNLSKDRMSPEEAERFWWPVFEGIGIKKDEVGIDEKANERPEPSLPDADEADLQPIEWNPDPDYDRISQPNKNKTLTPTCLDVLLSRPKYAYEHLFKFTKVENSVFGGVKCVIPGKPRPSTFWYSLFRKNSKLTGARADAYVAAGILALNMKHGSDTSLLKTPFPNSEAVRIPALYLDQEFLEREVDKNTSGVTGIIRDLRYYVPAGLLSQLGASVLESIRKKPEIDKPYGTLVWIINMILEGADPSLAIPLIQQFVLENPDASSWHRPLLNKKALIHFRPADAKSFFESFTDAILDKLQEQEERRAKKQPDDAPTNKGPLVKVTTVKMLAQLLRESPVVDPGLSVDLNIRIVKRASHVDIRTASIRGLTEAVAQTTNPEVKKRIFDALLKYAAPIASSINESQPLTDWNALTSGNELPEIWKPGYETPPIMELILQIGSKMDWQSEEGRLYKELVESVFKASAENQRHWMKLFIQRHSFSVPDDAQLPAIPMFPNVLSTLHDVMESETPIKYIDLARQYLLLMLNFPDWLSAIKDAVEADQKLLHSSWGRHWCYLWFDGFHGVKTRLFGTICLYLTNKEISDEKAQKKDSHLTLESFLFEIADALIVQGKLTSFDQFLSDTKDVNRDNAVWGRILERINGLRTPAWQADLNRKPPGLPDTLPLKIRMLDLPRETPEPDKAQEVVTRCANRVIELLNDIVSSGVPYFSSFDTLKRELMNFEPKVLMAIKIGSTPALDNANSVTLVDHLRADLAATLLDSSCIFWQSNLNKREGDIYKQAEELVMKMSASSVENFRKLAAPGKASIENTTGFDMWC